MSISKEALEFLINEGEEKNPILNLDQGTYSRVGLSRVEEVTAKSFTISTLTGLVDYIKSETDKLPEKLIIHVESPTQVQLFSPLNSDRKREQYLYAQAILPENIRYERFIDTEQFNIMLQSSFVANNDRDILLKYTGLVKDEAVKSIGDNGISQAVTIKTGVASVGQAEVPNPVTLAPYRTFPEVIQPESKFIFRMKEGPSAALFEADGGAWRNTAILGIKEYLNEALKENKNIQIIA